MTMKDLSIHSFLPEVKPYLLQAHPQQIPGWSADKDFTVSPLAQGEYNMNYLVQQGKYAWVLRINTGSQMGFSDHEQIAYEFKTLKLLEPAGVSPVPYFLDNTLQFLPYGVLGMSYLPGGYLDYRRDLPDAARLFAKYHQWPVNPAENHLIREEQPLTRMFNRSNRRLEVYFNSDLADPDLCIYLEEVRAWADQAKQREDFYIQDPWECIINTEVNNSNWIVNRAAGTLHLVDWEKPLWGDPSQDLSHFRVPTTTLWKSDDWLSVRDQAAMMDAYKKALHDIHLRDTIEERTRLRDPFNCLKAISWCALSWVEYQSSDHMLKNPETFHRFSKYLNLDFVRKVFDPYLKADY